MKTKNQQLLPLSIRDSFKDKTVFVIGATGFLGKVWLTQLLSQIQTFQKMYILIRGKGSQSGLDRFQNLINTSFVFEHLHEKFKSELSDYLNDKVEIIEGDVSLEKLGLDDEKFQTLTQKVDLTVNFAGLVDFNPELRDAFSINLQGAINVADFVRECKSKKLVHISTCYVAGTREGIIKEEVITNKTPNGKSLDINSEIQWIKSQVAKTIEDQNSPEQLIELRKMIEERNIELKKQPFSDKKIGKTIDNMKRKRLRESLTQLGLNRSIDLGWTNTYTYTKSLAEIALKQNYSNIELVIFRPSIVESSFSFPFAGWNEGFNTSGPLTYLMKTWFRHLPLKKGNPFDIIPVDFVARGLSISSAALLNSTHQEVYQCSSSDKNQLTIDRACQYTSESHSQYFKKHGDDWREKYLLSRWKTIPSRKDHPLSAHNMKKVFSTFERFFSYAVKVPFLGGLFKSAHNWLLKINRKLEQIEKLLELFYPFIHDYSHIFKSDSLFLYEIKEKEFEFSIQKINWEDYWINTQMPGLRRWCFPAIEGRSVEKYNPTQPARINTSIKQTNGHESVSMNGASKNHDIKTLQTLQTNKLRDKNIENKKAVE